MLSQIIVCLRFPVGCSLLRSPLYLIPLTGVISACCPRGRVQLLISAGFVGFCFVFSDLISAGMKHSSGPLCTDHVLVRWEK